MSDLEGLKTRVEQAVDQLSSVQNARQDQNQNLATLLGNLEEKFSARTVELDYCNSRIEALTHENAHLSELLERLVNLIESEPGNAEDDPLIRASTMAATLLEGWSGDSAPAEITSEVHETSEVPEPQELISEVPEPQELISEDTVSLSFDDVSDEELETENLENLDSDVSELVASAIAAAQNPDGEADEVSEIVEEIVEDDIMDAPVAVDIEIPDIDFADEDTSDDGFAEEIEEDTEASIRSMMARLEAAALEAKFMTSDDAAEEASTPEEAEQVA